MHRKLVALFAQLFLEEQQGCPGFDLDSGVLLISFITSKRRNSAGILFDDEAVDNRHELLTFVYGGLTVMHWDIADTFVDSVKVADHLHVGEHVDATVDRVRLL